MVTDRSPRLSAEEIEGRVLAFVRDELLSPEASLTRDDELLSGELLDSMGVLRLTAFVEEEFRIKVQPADFVIENFQNVVRIARYVLGASER